MDGRVHLEAGDDKKLMMAVALPHRGKASGAHDGPGRGGRGGRRTPSCSPARWSHLHAGTMT